MMNPPAAFLESLKAYDKTAITARMKKALKTVELLNNPVFTYDNICRKSAAAANIANWVINVVKYHDIYEVVE